MTGSAVLRSTEGSRTIKADAKTRLVEAASALFAERGFGGVSVREICRAAGTSSNMIHHYFGNKEGLYKAVLAEMTEDVFSVPMRLLKRRPESQDEFVQLMELFMDETLEALIAHRSAYTVVMRDQVDLPAVADYTRAFTDFLQTAREDGLVRDDVDPEMITGLILDRLGTQVIHAPWVQRVMGVDVTSDDEYRTRWMRANTSVIIRGLLP